MIEFDQPLSTEGIARRHAMLGIAKRAARSRRQKRHLVRTGAVVALLLVVAALSIGHFNNRPATVAKNPESPNVVAISLPSMTIEEIKTDPTIADRLSIQATKPKWIVINDDDLLTTLAKAGQPSGLIHTDGETILVTQELEAP